MQRLAMLWGLILALASAAGAQAPTWEMLPLFPQQQLTRSSAVDFLYGEGAAADDPAADSLVFFGNHGVFLYNPSGAAGSAGANGKWGAWHRLCLAPGATCSSLFDGFVTAAGSIIIGSLFLSRATNRGREWHYQVEGYGTFAFLESALPALVGPAGAPGILAGALGGGVARSLVDGTPGTWTVTETNYGAPQALGEVPPSAALPGGRIIYGVHNGVVYSDDGGLSFTPSNAYGQSVYIAYSFTFLPDAEHPYGGVAYAGLDRIALYPAAAAEVHRSDDGGATWTLAYRFTPDETGQPPINGYNVVQPTLYATPDGVLWSGVSFRNGSFPNRGGIMRSLDGGATWARADAGFVGDDGRGYRVNQLRLARDGRLYAATERGVWRTTQPVVSSEAWATSASAGLRLNARPNPSRGPVVLMFSSERAERVRVEVVDTSGRVVFEAVEIWTAPSGTEVRLPSERWAAGVYVARASVGRHTERVTARFTIVR